MRCRRAAGAPAPPGPTHCYLSLAPVVFLLHSYAGDTPGPSLPRFAWRSPEATPSGLSRVTPTFFVASGALRSAEGELRVNWNFVI